MAGYGLLIKAARDAEGLTQEELADHIGVSRGTMGHIENELVAVDAEKYVRIITTLRGIKPVELLESMGFPVGVPGADQLPPELVRALLPLSEDDLLTVLRVARGLQREPAGRR